MTVGLLCENVVDLVIWECVWPGYMGITVYVSGIEDGLMQ